MGMVETLAFKIGDWVITPPPEVPKGGLGKLEKILQVGVGLLLIAGGVMAMIYLMWGGINYITAGGDKQKIDSARRKIIYAIVGLIITFTAYALVTIIGSILGVNLIKPL